MTPRIKIKALDDDNTLDEAIDILTEYHYSRIPVYHETIDNIDRIVTLKELLRIRKKNKGVTPISELNLTSIAKIPRSQPIDTLLEKFQKTHKHIAVIVDEYG
jgi:CBS domain containing-hemolysin-like protein